jgi:hypothetical protein
MQPARTEQSDRLWSVNTAQVIQTSSAIHQAIAQAQVVIKKVQEISLDLFEKLQERVVQTPLQPVITLINELGSDIEKGFNIAGCTPFICILSGNIRILAGKLQILAGSVIAAIGELALFIMTKPDADTEILNKWRTLSKLGTEHIIHGCLNVLRGTGESWLGSWTMGIANIFLIAPNLNQQRNFGAFFAYGTLVNSLLQPSETNIQIEIQPMTSQ